MDLEFFGAVTIHLQFSQFQYVHFSFHKYMKHKMVIIFLD